MRRSQPKEKQVPEPNTTVVEEPKTPVVETPAPTEEQITETYIEQRKEGKTEDLPVPPPAIPEAKTEDVTIPEQQTVDAYLAERGERERKRRGGKQARIDELTKEKAELEERVATEAKKAEEATKAVEEAKKLIPVPETKVPEALKGAPKMEDFGTDANAYQAALGLWVAEQSKPAPVEKAPEASPVSTLRKEEFDRFLEKGKLFISKNPDFNTTLEAAHIRGLTMSESARVAITRMALPEVAYWLAKPENDMAARAFMQMDDFQQTVEVGKIAERLHVSPSDFVSNAPPPGTRLTGSNVRADLPLNEISDTDEYIRQRKLQRRQARR